MRNAENRAEARRKKHENAKKQKRLAQWIDVLIEQHKDDAEVAPLKAEVDACIEHLEALHDQMLELKERIALVHKDLMPTRKALTESVKQYLPEDLQELMDE